VDSVHVPVPLTRDSDQWAQLMAGNVIATASLILAFLFARKRSIATMSFTGLKG
jgi:multiple sugar transport system permease protein